MFTKSLPPGLLETRVTHLHNMCLIHRNISSIMNTWFQKKYTTKLLSHEN